MLSKILGIVFGCCNRFRSAQDFFMDFYHNQAALFHLCMTPPGHGYNRSQLKFHNCTNTQGGKLQKLLFPRRYWQSLYKMCGIHRKVHSKKFF